MTPELFAQNLFSDFKYTFCSVFSPDGNEYYFAAARSEDDKAGICWMRRMNDEWTKPEPAPFNSPEINHDMRLSADGSKIYFQSWTELINMGAIINSKHIENCPTISLDGNCFFFQRFDGFDLSETYWVNAKIIDESKPK